jgi:hypothetical protein
MQRTDHVGDLAGTVLPGGTFELSAEDHRRFAVAVGADPAADPTLTALWVVTSDLRGFGLTLTDVFALAGCDMVADGPMLGSCEMELTRTLEVGRPYETAGEILSLERKTGRRSGTFDLMRVRLSLSDAGGEVAAAVISYVLPRRTA